MAGAIYGLGTGIIVTGIQLMAGESVEERWNREFITIEEKKRAQEAAAAKKAIEERKDVREKGKKEEEKRNSERLVLPEEQTPYRLETEDYVRLFSIKVTRLLETIGILTPSDRYTVMEGDDESDSDSSR